MTGHYKAYPEYKNSGHKWLGDIPSQWNIWRAKRIFSSVRVAAKDTDEQLAASQKYGVVPQSLMMKLNSAKVMLALKGTDSFRHVEKDNFVISLRSFEGGIEHSAYEGCVSPAYTVLEASLHMHSAFYKYLLKCEPFIAALQSSTDSLRDGKSISYEQFGAIHLPYCSYEEQQKIASFLDHETAKIDTLITKQEKLIELLKEKRQAVISHAVTKGLNPNTPMKNSGVEWLGEVPEHWGTSRLKFVTSIFGRIGFRGYTTDDIVDEGEGALVLSPSNVLNGKLDLNSKAYLSWDKYYESPEIIVEPNDILLVKTGSTYGKSAIVESNSEPMTINPQMALLKKSKISAKYLAYVMSSDLIKAIIKVSNTGSGMPTMTQENINSFPIPTPSDSEAKNIVNFLDQRTTNIDNLIKLAGKAIEIINKRKAALISAAVTGKIDVRNWQPQGDQK
ncbi:restriction modification system DNA specificity domain-containing protein [Marinomonas pontica]|uniref:Restriction modification system DNA specificity domain-containing protein n=1 Tax=Marinomonas pontica TaxID=264739 RepID=A0ABM8F9Q0_9GAMM|nr:restriction modification system DNA specificity domain-containing protein [Marinomonas pontica]